VQAPRRNSPFHGHHRPLASGCFQARAKAPKPRSRIRTTRLSPDRKCPYFRDRRVLWQYGFTKLSNRWAGTRVVVAISGGLRRAFGAQAMVGKRSIELGLLIQPPPDLLLQAPTTRRLARTAQRPGGRR